MPTIIGRPGGHARARATHLRATVDRLLPARMLEDLPDVPGPEPEPEPEPESEPEAPRQPADAAGRDAATRAPDTMVLQRVTPSLSSTLRDGLPEPAPPPERSRALSVLLTILSALLLAPVLNALARSHAAGTGDLTAWLPGHGGDPERARLWGLAVAVAGSLLLTIPLDALWNAVVSRWLARRHARNVEVAGRELDRRLVEEELAWRLQHARGMAAATADAAVTPAPSPGNDGPASNGARPDRPRPTLAQRARRLHADAAHLAEQLDAEAALSHEVAQVLDGTDAWYVLHDAVCRGHALPHVVLGPGVAVVLPTTVDPHHDRDDVAAMVDSVEEVIGTTPALLRVGPGHDAIPPTELAAAVADLHPIMVERSAASRRLTELTGAAPDDPHVEELLERARALRAELVPAG